MRTCLKRFALRLLEHEVPHLLRQVVLGEERVRELLALGVRERLELDRRRADAPAAPAGPDVQELRPGETEDQQGDVSDPRGEVLDEVEQRILGPVDVLEDEDERLRLRELLGPRARRPGELLAAALALDRREDSGGEAEQVG